MYSIDIYTAVSTMFPNPYHCVVSKRIKFGVFIEESHSYLIAKVVDLILPLQG